MTESISNIDQTGPGRDKPTFDEFSIAVPTVIR
jgi:hypothetical protein